MAGRLLRAPVALVIAVVLGACATTTAPVASHTPTPLAGALSQGLIAYASNGGIGVLDPQTGKTVQIVTLAPGAFRVAGPVWAHAPGLAYPVIYFAIHDNRPMESRNTSGVIPYDWIFRADPFTGDLTPLAAQADLESEGPFGLVANAHFLALTVGCCTDYQVDVLDLTRPNAKVRVLTRPPDQPALFTEGAEPGLNGLIAVRGFATGAWYFLNPTLGVLHKFPLAPGADDGPVAFNAAGTMAAVSLLDHGAVIEPVNLAPILETPSTAPETSATAAPSPSSSASPSPSASVVPPRRVNSKLPHVDSLAWSPDSTQLAIAVSGQIQIYAVAGKDGDKPLAQYAAGGGVTGIDWSGPLLDRTPASIKPAPKPQTFVDALLAATKLPQAADTPQNRPLTNIYLWSFDSSKASPIASITDATPDVLAKYPPLAAIVDYHHWTAQDPWAMVGGCIRYRVVISGSIKPVAATFGLTSNALCSAQTASPSASASTSPSKSP